METDTFLLAEHGWLPNNPKHRSSSTGGHRKPYPSKKPQRDLKSPLNGIRVDRGSHMGGGRRRQPFNVDLTGVEEQADEGLGIVRVGVDVAQYDKSVLRTCRKGGR